MVLAKHEIEAALHAEHQAISAGHLKEDNPLDVSEDFRLLCEACRRNDLKVCQEMINEGVNINARDRFDYTPLILASLCGHFEVVQLLLESGALCERDTFQGERCLYNALNDRIRNLLLSYDYSKSRDPLQPLAGHVTSLLYRDIPVTSDITLIASDRTFKLHKFVLAARSPYFARKLAVSPETTTWRIPPAIPSQSLDIAIKAIYLQEVNLDFGAGAEGQAILAGIEKLGRQLEMSSLFDTLLEADRRLARQRRSDEISRGRDQMETWYKNHVFANKREIPINKVKAIKWDCKNSIFADVLLCAGDYDEPVVADGIEEQHQDQTATSTNSTEIDRTTLGIGPLARPSQSRSASQTREPVQHNTILFPAHRAMLLRSDYFNAMFSSPFAEAQVGEHLPVIHLDCSPEVLEIILTYLYTERADFGLAAAIDVLFAADLLFIEKLKVRAAMIISTLGNDASSAVEVAASGRDAHEADSIDIYDVIRAGWDTRVHRLEEFGARYIANRLEQFVEEAEFKALVRESAARITRREETDTVELIDDIRYYLSERFRLRFEDSGLDEMMNDEFSTPASELAHFETGEKETPQQVVSSKEKVGQLPLTTREAYMPPLQATAGAVRTLDGKIAGDEFAQDAINYQILLGKIDTLLESLQLDA